jgi:hypothetical protein
VVAESRTMKGSGAAGVAMLGAADIEVAQNVLTETQSAILPLVPYLDTLRWVFIAVALVGIAVTIYARLDDWRRGSDYRDLARPDRRQPIGAGDSRKNEAHPDQHHRCEDDPAFGHTMRNSKGHHQQCRRAW